MSVIRLLLVVLCLVFAGCGKPYSHVFNKGDIAVVKLDGQRVQVTDIYPHDDRVRVMVPLSTGGYKYMDLRESDLSKP